MTIWMLFMALLALVSTGGAAFSWVYYAGVNQRIQSLESRVASIRSKMSSEERSTRKLVQEELETLDAQRESGGGLDDEMMMQMMLGMMGGQQGGQAQPRRPQPQPAPEEPETPDEPEEPNPNGSGSGILDTIAALEQDQ